MGSKWWIDSDEPPLPPETIFSSDLQKMEDGNVVVLFQRFFFTGGRTVIHQNSWKQFLIQVEICKYTFRLNDRDSVRISFYIVNSLEKINHQLSRVIFLYLSHEISIFMSSIHQAECIWKSMVKLWMLRLKWSMKRFQVITGSQDVSTCSFSYT